MLKSDILDALSQIRLVSGGTVSGLIEEAKAGRAKLEAALRELGGHSDTSQKNAARLLSESISPLTTRLSSISPSATAIELHDLGKSFDRVMREYPSIEPLLRPGRQGLAHLAGAYDIAFQQNRHPSVVVGIVGPALELATCYEHYTAIAQMFAEQSHEGGEESASITIAGVEQLDAFAAYAELLSNLARISASIIREAEGQLARDGSVIWIERIDSGSPIQFIFKGDGRALRFFLSMVRDAFRTIYQRWSTHGQLMQAMETLAAAKELGVTSAVALSKLNDAVVATATKYADSVSGQNVSVLVEGKPITTPVALPQITSGDHGQTIAPRLLPPEK